MQIEYVLKHHYTDFIVEEVSAIAKTKIGEYAYATLDKSGITTFEALNLLAEHFHIDTRQIAAAGLKDEDAVTKQVISFWNTLPTATYIELAPTRWLKLSEAIGFSNKPTVRGSLFGNFFWIVIRNLSPEVADVVQQAAEPHGYFRLNFVNYFDHQRFGLPGSKYRTGEVGEHLLSGRLEQSARILYEEGVEVKKNGLDLPGYQERFVTLIDNGLDSKTAMQCIHQRMHAFYISSYFSKCWNKSLSQKISSHGNGVLLYKEAGHPLHGCLGIEGKKILEEIPYALPLKEAVYLEQTGEMIIKDTQRSTITSAKLFVLDKKIDPEFPGKTLLQIHFYLPSGCYGTAAVHQMLQTLTSRR